MNRNVFREAEKESNELDRKADSFLRGIISSRFSWLAGVALVGAAVAFILALLIPFILSL